MSSETEDAAIAFLLRLDPATQREVLRRYEEILQVELDTPSARLRRIAVALHQTTRTLGHPPSVREYKRLRNDHPERGWPDPRSITRWLAVRTWSDALVRMRLEPLLEGDVIEGSGQAIYGIAEVVQALRDCAVDLGRVPTVTDYLAWQRRPDVRERPGRRPGSSFVFGRLFGGFGPARVAAGLVEGDPAAAHPTEFLLRSANYRMNREQILTGIREVETRTHGRLTATMYERERRNIYFETHAAKHPRALAGVGTIYRHFGSWPKALEAAGVDPSRGLAAHPGWVSDAQITDALVEAHRAAESLLTMAAYDVWREREAGRDPARRRLLPSAATITRRFGGWKAALDATGIDPNIPSGRFTNEEVFQALRNAGSTAPGRLTTTRYVSWREQESNGDHSRLRALPSLVTILRRFDNWPSALDAAGINVAQKGQSLKFSDEHLLLAMSKAERSTTGPLSIERYRVWRRNQVASSIRGLKQLPSSSTIRNRFGDWTTALKRLHDWRQDRDA